jgi:hypothetical protein
MPSKAHSLSGLSGADLAWMSGVVEAVLAPKIDELTGSKGIGRQAAKAKHPKRPS